MIVSPHDSPFILVFTADARSVGNRQLFLSLNSVPRNRTPKNKQLKTHYFSLGFNVDVVSLTYAMHMRSQVHIVLGPLAYVTTNLVYYVDDSDYDDADNGNRQLEPELRCRKLRVVSLPGQWGHYTV